jgi:hypothetical protein
VARLVGLCEVGAGLAGLDIFRVGKLVGLGTRRCRSHPASHKRRGQALSSPAPAKALCRPRTPRARAQGIRPCPDAAAEGLSTTAACEGGWGKVEHRAATMGVAALPLSMYGAPWPSIARLTASRWKAKGDGSATGSPSVLYGKPRTGNFSTVHDEDG